MGLTPALGRKKGWRQPDISVASGMKDKENKTDFGVRLFEPRSPQFTVLLRRYIP